MRWFAGILAGLWLCLAHPAQASAWGWPLQCVPFARSLSGVRLFGDAWRWWSEAVGRYDRGSVPQPGSVLSFRPSLQMPLGHVAVVTKIVGPRRIEIDHANWAAPGAITTSVAAVDVSDRNDWSAVRVELGRSERFGSVYATNGFIYAKGGRPGFGWDQPELIYIGRALEAARRTPRPMGAAGYAAVSQPVARQGLLPWNPIPLTPALPGFPAQKSGQGWQPQMSDQLGRANGRMHLGRMPAG